MPGHRARWAAGAAALAVVLAVTTAGCADDSPDAAASRAASAASSLASEAQRALESATAEAERRFDELREGVDVKADVRLGTPAVGGDGRASVEVSAHNTADSTRSFAVQVDFTDRDGRRLDTVVVTVGDVPPGKDGTATARSTHDLPDEIRAEVARAVRY